MNIATIGRGHIGGGLARLWRQAGHHVAEFGRAGGDVSQADVILIAVPGSEITPALTAMSGVAGKLAIDATNILPVRHGDFPSYAEEVKSVTGGPVAKSFNMNFGALLDSARSQRVPPSNLYAADPEARDVTEQLIRDAGYDPAFVGDLSRARELEDAVWLLMSLQPVGGLYYRFAPPGQL